MELKLGYKQTEAGIIPEDWTVHRIGDSMRLINGRAFKPGDWTDHGLPIIRIQNLNDPSSSFNYYAGSVESRHRIEAGDLLFAWSGTTGTSFGARIWSGPTGVLNQHIFKVQPDQKKLSPSYAFLVLGKVQERIEKQAHGFKASFVHVKKSDLVGVELPLPSTNAEQEAIAEALSDADALIESLEQLLAKKRLLKQGAMQELLTGKTRLPGFTHKWELRPLGELASIQRGASPRPIDSPIWFEANSSVGWVRISDVTRAGMYLLHTDQRMSPLGVKYSRPVERGSLIMSICATVGRPVITGIETCIHDGFVVFNNLRPNKLFLYYALKFIEENWSKNGQTGSQMNLNTGLINRTSVYLPEVIDEQIAIATILSDIDADISALEVKRAKALRIKQAMMQELLTGRIRLL